MSICPQHLSCLLIYPTLCEISVGFICPLLCRQAFCVTVQKDVYFEFRNAEWTCWMYEQMFECFELTIAENGFTQGKASRTSEPD